MQIGELSRKTGKSRDALRLYERLGLIRSQRRSNGYRDYDNATPRLVAMITLAQSLGFTLSEITPEMQTIAKQGLGTPAVAALLAAKLQDVDTRIADLTRKRNELAEMISQVCPITPP